MPRPTVWFPGVTDRLKSGTAVTVTEAELPIEPTVAVIVPVPGAVAVNVVGLPGLGEKVPSAGDADQLGVTWTGLPYASAPLALKLALPPGVSWALLGETATVASWAATTVSVCVALAYPVAAAVRIGPPALVSS